MKRTIITVILTFALTAFSIQAVEQTAFSGAGVIESTTGGFMFPDGSTQLSAASPPCTAITSVPFTINSSGIYCFTGNLQTDITSGDAITINAHNVTVDLNGWTLDGSGGGGETTANGVFASTKENITIRNGTIQGFYWGIYLHANLPTNHGGHLIEEIRAVKNRKRGMSVSGTDNTIRRNHVISTGDLSGVYSTFGISLKGDRVQVLNNSITNTRVSGDLGSTALNIEYADDAVIDGNRIAFVSSDTGVSHGIRILNSFHVIAKENTISSADFGIDFLSSSGKYRDNVTSNVTTTYTGGTDTTGNY